MNTLEPIIQDFEAFKYQLPKKRFNVSSMTPVVLSNKDMLLKLFIEHKEFREYFSNQFPATIRTILCDDEEFMLNVISESHKSNLFNYASVLPSTRLKNSISFAIAVGSLWQHYLKRFPQNIRNNKIVLISLARNGQFALHWAKESQDEIKRDVEFMEEYYQLQNNKNTMNTMIKDT